MITKKYLINPLGVLFHPEFDRKNNYRTIVCNPQNGKILKVNRFGYVILKALDLNPGLSLTELAKLLGQDMPKIERFLIQMIQEDVVFEKWKTRNICF